jgi:hypothetical protein
VFSLLSFPGEDLLDEIRGRAGRTFGGCSLFGGVVVEVMAARLERSEGAEAKVVCGCDGDELDRPMRDRDCRARRSVLRSNNRSEWKKLSILSAVVEVGASGERRVAVAILGESERNEDKGSLNREHRSSPSPPLHKRKEIVQVQWTSPQTKWKSNSVKGKRQRANSSLTSISLP